jgi:hypothetical protein
VAQETRDAPSETYRKLNSPRKPDAGYERRADAPRSAGSRIFGWISTVVAVAALLGIGYWVMSRPQASLPERLGRYPRVDNPTLETQTALGYQARTKGEVRVGVYGNKHGRVVMALFVKADAKNLDAFAAQVLGTNAQVFQDPKVFESVRRDGGAMRCVSGGVPTPFLSQCIWQEGGTFAILTSTEPTVPGAMKLTVASHEAAITSRLEGFLGSALVGGARATVPRS